MWNCLGANTANTIPNATDADTELLSLASRPGEGVGIVIRKWRDNAYMSI